MSTILGRYYANSSDLRGRMRKDASTQQPLTLNPSCRELKPPSNRARSISFQDRNGYGRLGLNAHQNSVEIIKAIKAHTNAPDIAPTISPPIAPAEDASRSIFGRLRRAASMSPGSPAAPLTKPLDVPEPLLLTNQKGKPCKITDPCALRSFDDAYQLSGHSNFVDQYGPQRQLQWSEAIIS
jgi:hypothetical protein